ncbi:NVEALA domain-containing protein [Parabacteroides segnis]|jgi:hypothetical protein|uniref:NVEALA domain-containing protein n=1 Tax=Parabacteroides segnis TaxID=2763058 RepID=A0ABR7E5K6_9BACT|nr:MULTISPECIES: NVEALA domain-containing protein [Parabacteroides]MBC5645059.1 NVEALA domain-containing protein [Parabacteroides segnis]MCM0712500.1 NVEALA domain-containing protein [Parabacteroides sp. TA-V-105]
MKKTIKTGFILLSLFGAWYFSHINSEKKSMEDLVLENIEALAWDENGLPDENFQCYNWGEVDCYGDKVEVKYSGYSLD